MSFFSKLKDRMFKSSSKLEAGLDAIVSDDQEQAPPTEAGPPPAVQSPDAAAAAPQDVIFDVGANVGYYSVLAHQCCGDAATIHAIGVAMNTASDQ